MANKPTGFIGLGTLGMPIAQHLLENGVELVVWNRTRAKAEALGAPVAASLTDVLARCDVVILNLRDSAAVHDVLTRPDGLLSVDLGGKIILDTTTNHYAEVQRFHELVAGAGGAYLEAPVLGSVAPASTGQLGVYVSGHQQTLDAVRPLLDIIGRYVEYFERPGLATAMKLIGNSVMGSFLATLIEAILLGEAAGVDKARVIELLNKGAGRSVVLDAKKQKLLDEDFTTHFAAELIHKDMTYAGDLARLLERPFMTGGAAREAYALTFLQGLGDQDFSVLYEVLKKRG